MRHRRGPAGLDPRQDGPSPVLRTAVPREMLEELREVARLRGDGPSPAKLVREAITEKLATERRRLRKKKVNHAARP